MLFTQADTETLSRLLLWRRDVRHFSDRPVDEAITERLRAAMDSAPSVGNARPWRVVRISDPALRDALRDNFEHANTRAAQQYDGEQRDRYTQMKLAGLDKAPLLLAVFTVPDPDEGSGLGRATMPQTLQQSTAMAIFSLWLTARVHNLGVGMVSILAPAPLNRLLNVPDEWEFSALLCVGHPEFTDDTPLLHRVGWQENSATDWLER